MINSIGEIIGWTKCCSGPIAADGVILHFNGCRGCYEGIPVERLKRVVEELEEQQSMGFPTLRALIEESTEDE